MLHFYFTWADKKMIKDNAALNKHGGTKYNQQKPRLGLISPLATFEEGIAMAAGEIKYADENWRQGLTRRELLEAAQRHIALALAGEVFDDETGSSHEANARCCLAFAIEMRYTRPDLDNVYKLPVKVISKMKSMYVDQLLPKIPALLEAKAKKNGV